MRPIIYVCIKQLSINVFEHYVIYFNIFYIFSDITVTILIFHNNSTDQQLNLSNTNKCQWDKRKVTRLGFEPTNLTSPMKITLLNGRLNRSAIVFVKLMHRK